MVSQKSSSTEDNLNISRFLKIEIEEVGVWVGWGSNIPNLALVESQVEHRAWLYQTASLCIPSLGSNVKTITLNGGTVSAVCHYSKVDDPFLFSPWQGVDCSLSSVTQNIKWFH